jgi:hypothetical protein
LPRVWRRRRRKRFALINISKWIIRLRLRFFVRLRFLELRHISCSRVRLVDLHSHHDVGHVNVLNWPDGVIIGWNSSSHGLRRMAGSLRRAFVARHGRRTATCTPQLAGFVSGESRSER